MPTNIVILTGAGISAESGVRTFRASDGLWEDHRIEDVATPEGFERDPELVQRFYNQRRAQLKTVNPNPAHYALAELESKLDGDFLLVTQNVDDLHERAGSKNLIHMHGELLKKRCTKSHIVSDCFEDLTGTGSRPHIVWFGEMPLEMERIYEALANCDLFISIGTSGNVYPAAGFVAEAKRHGAETIEINLEPTSSPYFDRKIIGKAGETLPDFIHNLIKPSN
jgi:NAD-dependent deacetylase